MDQNVAAFEKSGEDVSGTGSGAKPIRNRRRTLRSALFGAGVIGLLTTGTLYGQYWWRTGRFLASTDDAYLQADNVIISPKVSGYLLSVPVTDNQPVHAGQVLARIDDRDYLTALAAAQADVAAQQASIDNLTQQIGEQQFLISEARATVRADQAALVFARLDSERYTTLSKSGVSTIQNAQQATANLQEKQAALDHDTAAVSAAEKQVDVLDTQLAETRAALARKQAALRQAQLNEGYTAITSPVDGTVGARTLRIGQYVQAGTQLMAIVPLQAVYVTANYKETQLTDVRPGQPVTLEVDTFPGAAVHGVVNSIAPASGQEFALLPPDNATGNFTKIVQRLPVKITIDPDDPLIGQLRPGMSVEPTIDTKPKA
ncbi:MAG: rane fusion protein multidrug efflux system [Acetobacteraceae bacterium]|jgi:membrane fusion protein, multidrug efflux system|nr:rane fusion protein multidrug efflux system [Acetobacteraceae bacterium]